MGLVLHRILVHVLEHSHINHEFMNACNQLNSITGVEQMLRDRSSSVSKESMHVKSACEAGYAV